MDQVAHLLRDGKAAARAGKKAKARHKFRSVLISDPTNVPALLWLAWLSDDPRASLAYVARALACDPHNPRAHAALQWARRRMTAPAPRGRPCSPTSGARVSRPRWGRSAATVALGLLIVLTAAAAVWLLPDHLPVLAALAPSPSPTATSVPSPTATSTKTATPVPTLTLTWTPTPSPVHTATPPPSPSPTPTPTATATAQAVLPTAPPLPPTATLAPLSIAGNVRWIDVDLTNQRLTAYEGQTVVRTTLVSTGLPRTPTPTGQYHVQLKLRSDAMSGPGYYLPDVPYVMYFYRGYGLHGTYWHSNFGHPMSHGCVNLPTPEAEWLFNWAEVGTLVNVHN